MRGDTTGAERGTRPAPVHPLARMLACRCRNLGPLDDEGGRTCRDCGAVRLCPGWHPPPAERAS